MKVATHNPQRALAVVAFVEVQRNKKNKNKKIKTNCK